LPSIKIFYQARFFLLNPLTVLTKLPVGWFIGCQVKDCRIGWAIDYDRHNRKATESLFFILRKKMANVAR
jgi:hypothetical protein